MANTTTKVERDKLRDYADRLLDHSDDWFAVALAIMARTGVSKDRARTATANALRKRRKEGRS